MWTPPFVLHSWRQSQTAFTIREFARHGIDLLNPRVPVFGRPWVLIYEFPLFQAIAALFMRLGPSAETSGRWLSLVCFFVSAVLLERLLRVNFDRMTASLGLMVFVFSPFSLFWSSAVLVEYMAVAFTLLAASAANKIVVRATPRWVVIGGISSILASVVKASTPIVLLPLLAAILWSAPASVRRRLVTFVGTATTILFSSLAWTAYADSVKSSNPFTAGSVTGGMVRESIKALADGRLWSLRRIPWEVFVHQQVGGLALFCVVAYFTIKSKNIIRIAALMTPLFGFVVFPIQFGVHTYYAAATTPAVALAVGCAMSDVVCLRRSTTWRYIVTQVWVVAVALSSSLLLRLTFAPPWTDNHPGLIELEKEVKATTSPGENIAAVGLSWSPVWLYGADRKGLIIAPDPEGVNRKATRQELQDGGYRAIAFYDAPTFDARLLDVFSWIGASTPHVARMGPALEDLRGSSFVATNEAVPGTASDLASPTRALICDGRGAIDSRPGFDLLVRLGPATQSQRLVASESLTPLPGRRTVILRSNAATPKDLSLGCIGGGSIAVLGIVPVPAGALSLP
jgi:Dolichyl-phosphate-mannose-protein mannosyltransferase